MFFWIMLIILVITTVASYLLTPRPKTGAPQPSALGDFTLPTAQAGRIVPVIYGTVKLAGGNCTYWGDLQITSLSEHHQIYAYMYRLGIQLALCYGGERGGEVEFISFLADDKIVPITSGVDPNDVLNIWIRAYNFFGGDKQEGGVAGTIMFYNGHPANDPKPQVADAYLARIQGRAVPAYRGICHAVFVGFYVGTSSYVKTLGFILKRCPNPFNYLIGPASPTYPAPVATFPRIAEGDFAGSFFDQAGEQLYWFAESHQLGGTAYATINKLDVPSRALATIQVALENTQQVRTNFILADPLGAGLYVCAYSGYGGGSLYKLGADGSFIESDGSSMGAGGWCHGLPSASNSAIMDDAGKIIFVDWSGAIIKIDFEAIDIGTGTHCFPLGWAMYSGGLGQSAIPVVDDGGIIYVFSQDPNQTHNYVSVSDGTFDGGTPVVTNYLLKTGDDDSGNPILSAPGSIVGGIFVPADNTIIWGTSQGLFKWSISAKVVVASLPGPILAMSSYVGADGFIVWGVSKVDPVSLDVVLPLTLSEFTLPIGDDLLSFGHPYDALANCVFLMDAGGNVQELSLVSAGSGISDINGDANPALMIYDLLTHPVYGLRKSAAVIDQSSFDYAARTLANEGLGMSEIIDTATDADSMIGDILRHIDGTLYCDPATGLFTLKLARADYDPATLPELTVDEVIDSPDFSRGSWAETTNQVSVTFYNRADNFNQDVSAPCQDTANIAITGTLNAETIDFKGISNQVTATLVAARSLRALSYPLAKLTVKTNRTSWKLRPAQCFRFTWTPLGISDQIFRVAKISYGKIDDGTITIDAVEDVFNLSTVAFDAPPGSGWKPPAQTPPPPVAAQALAEVPYFYATDGIRVFALAARGDATSYQCGVYQNLSDHFAETATLPGFAATATLSIGYSQGTLALDPVGFTVGVSGSVDLGTLSGTDKDGQLAGGNLAMFATGEIVSWQAIVFNADGTATFSRILRGLFDTVPTTHAAGERVWFIPAEMEFTQANPYPADLLVRAKFLPTNFVGSLPLSSATEIDLQTASRYAKPWPPGNLRMDALAFGSFYSTTTNDVTFSWSSRNRLTQTSSSTIVLQDAGDQGAIEGTYTVDVLVGGNVVRSVANSTAESFTYTATERIADSTIGEPVVLRITPTNGSLAGNPNSSPAFTMTGFGLQFGCYFGGIQQ